MAAAGAGSLPSEAERLLDDAEDALQRGLVEEASSLARAVLTLQTAVADRKARAINVLTQADFHFHNRLIDLNGLLHEAGLPLEQLPVTTVLLWGVVAVELQAADVARSLLKRYLGAKNFGEGSGVTREDCLALSRLYAVQLLSGLCGDFQAAADWLDAGGAGLSEEQQELLLLEVDEAEELAQEEHVAVWTTQDAAQAAQLGSDHAHHLSNGAAAAGAAAAAEMSDTAGPDCGTDTGSVVGSLASTAVAALHELGPSVSGVLSNQSLHPAGEATEQEDDSTVSPAEAPQPAAAAAAPPSNSSHSSSGSSSVQAAPAAEAATAAAAAEALALPVPQAPAAVAVRGFEDGERVPSSPSLASWRRSPDEVAVQDQGQRDGSSDNPFVTITGAFNDQGYDPEVAAELAAAAAAAGAAGSRGGSAASPEKARKALLRHSNNSSGSSGSVKSRLRGVASDIAAAAAATVATVTAAVSRGEQSDASAGTARSSEAEQQQEEVPADQPADPDQQQQQQGGDSLQERLSAYSSWAADKANEAWSSQPVQDALKALNLQDVPPWELAGGAAAAALLTYTLYRNRRRMRRAAADFAAGVAQTARMGLGMSVNPMAAVPGTGHLMRS